jgi:adenylylsulfate kinase-like enzyme
MNVTTQATHHPALSARGGNASFELTHLQERESESIHILREIADCPGVISIYEEPADTLLAIETDESTLTDTMKQIVAIL